MLEVRYWLDIFERMNDSARTTWYMCKTAENFVFDVKKYPQCPMPTASRRAGPVKV